MKCLSAFLLLICPFLSVSAQQQKHTRFHSYSTHEAGITAGFSRYELSELFGPSDEYNAAMLALSYHLRAAQHLQLGVSGEVGMAYEVADISSFSFNMSFPVGRGESYFYPGWHYTNAMGFNGLGLHVGGVKTINHWLAANIHCNGTMFFLGYRLSGAAGIRARF